MLWKCGWRRLLRVPWAARKSNQSILKEISPEYSQEGLILKLNIQYFGYLIEELTHWKRPWCWGRLKVGRDGDSRGWDSWMASLTGCTWVRASCRSCWWTGKPGVLQFMGWQSRTWLSDWTELNLFFLSLNSICLIWVWLHPLSLGCHSFGVSSFTPSLWIYVCL